MARNGADFINRVETETGLKLEIIDRETEARLAAKGSVALIDSHATSAVIFDIGGGSTEVMWMERGATGFEVKAWTSLPAGVVTLSEQLGGGAHVTPEIFTAMRTHVYGLLAPFVKRVLELNQGVAAPSHLLGTSGTVTTIAGVHLGLRHYDRAKVDGCWMTSTAVADVTERLLAMSYQQRIANGCIGRDRADLVLAGCAILEEVRAAFPADRVRVADRGLREGILADMIEDSMGETA